MHTLTNDWLIVQLSGYVCLRFSSNQRLYDFSYNTRYKETVAHTLYETSHIPYQTHYSYRSWPVSSRNRHLTADALRYSNPPSSSSVHTLPPSRAWLSQEGWCTHGSLRCQICPGNPEPRWLLVEPVIPRRDHVGLAAIRKGGKLELKLINIYENSKYNSTTICDTSQQKVPLCRPGLIWDIEHNSLENI